MKSLKLLTYLLSFIFVISIVLSFIDTENSEIYKNYSTPYEEEKDTINIILLLDWSGDMPNIDNNEGIVETLQNFVESLECNYKIILCYFGLYQGRFDYENNFIHYIMSSTKFNLNTWDEFYNNIERNKSWMTGFNIARNVALNSLKEYCIKTTDHYIITISNEEPNVGDSPNELQTINSIAHEYGIKIEGEKFVDNINKKIGKYYAFEELENIKSNNINIKYLRLNSSQGRTFSSLISDVTLNLRRNSKVDNKLNIKFNLIPDRFYNPEYLLLKYYSQNEDEENLIYVDEILITKDKSEYDETRIYPFINNPKIKISTFFNYEDENVFSKLKHQFDYDNVPLIIIEDRFAYFFNLSGLLLDLGLRPALLALLLNVLATIICILWFIIIFKTLVFPPIPKLEMKLKEI